MKYSYEYQLEMAREGTERFMSLAETKGWKAAYKYMLLRHKTPYYRYILPRYYKSMEKYMESIINDCSTLDEFEDRTDAFLDKRSRKPWRVIKRKVLTLFHKIRFKIDCLIRRVKI